MSDDELINLIATPTTTPQVRTQLMETWIRSNWRTTQNIAYNLCNKTGLNPTQHVEDVHQQVLITVHELLQLAAEQKLPPNYSMPGLIWARTRPKVQDYADSAASGRHSSGTTAITRRIRKLRQTKERMETQLGREPTDQEVVDQFNQDHKHLKNAARQMMVATTADLNVRTGLVTLSEEEHGTMSNTHMTPSYVTASLLPHEGTELLEKLVIHAIDMGRRDLAVVYQNWLGPIYDPEHGEPATVQQLAKQLKVTQARAAELIVEAGGLARMISDELGVNDTL